MRSQRAEARFDGPRLLLLSLEFFVLLWGLAYLAFQANHAVDSECVDTKHLLPDWWLLLAGGAALVAGRVVFRAIHRDYDNPSGSRLSDSAGILATMLLFAAAGGALLFEAVGVLATQTTTTLAASVQDLEPITHYVRCSIYYDKLATNGFGYATWAMIVLTGVVAGHWLWPAHPPRAAEAGGGARPVRPLVHPIFAAVIALVVLALIVYVLLIFLDVAFLTQPAVRQAVFAQQATGATFQGGMTGVVIFVFGVFVAISGLDLFFTLRRWDSLSTRVQGWARSNPWLSFALLGVLGALIAHFVGNSVHYR